MAEVINQRDLRNHMGEITRRLDRGESLNGAPVGELTPLRRHRFVNSVAVVALFGGAPGIDAARFSTDLGRSATQDIEPRS